MGQSNSSQCESTSSSRVDNESPATQGLFCSCSCSNHKKFPQSDITDAAAAHDNSKSEICESHPASSPKARSPKASPNTSPQPRRSAYIGHTEEIEFKRQESEETQARRKSDVPPLVQRLSNASQSSGSAVAKMDSIRASIALNAITGSIRLAAFVTDDIMNYDPAAPFKAIPFKDFRAHKSLPRSHDRLAVPVIDMAPNTMVIFISHRWFRPWNTKAECQAHGEQWAGHAHPDNTKRQKFQLIVEGIEVIAQSNSWSLDQVAIWLDYTCVEQDDPALKLAGIKSLLAYAAACELVLIPCPEQPTYPVAHMVPDGYGDRAWTRLEAFAFYVFSMLRGKDAPELYTTSPGGITTRIDYDLLPDAMPATGVITNEEDRAHVEIHQGTLLTALHRRALLDAQLQTHRNDSFDGPNRSNSDIGRLSFASADRTHSSMRLKGCVGPALIALAALGRQEQVEELIGLRSPVDAADNRGFTALISAARYDRFEIVQMLLAARAYTEYSNSFGWTPLIMCCRKGNSRIAKLLLDAKADTSHGWKGKTPLQLAESKNHKEVVALLMQHGAKREQSGSWSPQP